MSRLAQSGGPPSPASLLARVDLAAKAAGQAARAQVQPIVASQVPQGRTGQLAAATKVSVRQIPTGQAVTVAVPRGRSHGNGASVAQVARWVQQGTGELRAGGGSKRPIRSKRPGGMMTLPGGRKVRSVRGQAPNPYMARIKLAADPVVHLAFREGARKAAGT